MAIKVTKRRVLVLSALVFITVGVAYEMMAPLRFNKTRILWSNRSQEGVDTSRFMVIMFPLTNSIKQNVSELGIEVNVIDRAILATLDELEHETIIVFVDKEKTVEVAGNEFTALPPGESVDKYIDKLNAAIKKWRSETDWRKISFRRTFADAGNERVNVKVFSKRGDAIEYEYKVDSDGEITPNAIKLYRGKW